MHFEVLRLIIGNIGIFSVLASLTLFPLKFKYSIHPAIEKKMGVKLKHAPTWDVIPFGHYQAYLDSAAYIVAMHIAFLRGRKPKPVSERKSPRALSKIGYAVEDFSKREIVWSYLVIINAILCFACGGLLFFFNPGHYS